jgi:hypothetical protein
MLKRLLCLALLVFVVGSSSGCRCICCLHDNLLASYKSRRWADCGCGPSYYGPWISDPPDCCDPCDCAGHFTGQRQYWTPGPQQWRNQGGFSDGTMMTEGMDGMESIPSGQPVPNRMQPGGAPSPNRVPTPADPPMGRTPRNVPPPYPAPSANRRPRPRPVANPYQTSSMSQSPW